MKRTASAVSLTLGDDLESDDDFGGVLTADGCSRSEQKYISKNKVREKKKCN